MSEETGEHDAVPKEPSFHGRLQLKDFIFDGTAHIPSGSHRRSPRLQTSQAAATTLSSGSATPSESTSVTRRTAPKRKTTARGAKGEEEEEKEDSGTTPSPRKKKKKQRTRTPASYAPPSTYAHLPPLTDVIARDLLVLFIGLNPGVQTARTGHAYAHPSNLFWKLLYSSGITPVACRAEEDGTLPARFALGNTNIVARPSRNGAELSRAEMDAGVAVLEDKCRRWRPEAVCVVGKGIWESIFRVWRGRNLARGEFEYGWQTERMGAVPPAPGSAAVRIGRAGAGTPDGGGGDKREGDDGPWEGARIFVATSTSGLAATLRPEEKERIWKILGDWCVQRRKERAGEKTG
ncbi:DNA glycosylase [Xylaria sp. FL1777]|nr:DNA glycosylase [Xylaria sp. FL1777]